MDENKVYKFEEELEKEIKSMQAQASKLREDLSHIEDCLGRAVNLTNEIKNIYPNDNRPPVAMDESESDRPRGMTTPL